MSHAELCPVCRGAGRLPMFPAGTSTAGPTVACHECEGSGWVRVMDVSDLIDHSSGSHITIKFLPEG